MDVVVLGFVGAMMGCRPPEEPPSPEVEPPVEETSATGHTADTSPETVEQWKQPAEDFVLWCEYELGRIPGFDCMDDGIQPPITVNGVPIESYDPENQVCDHPEWLGAVCRPYTRIGRIDGEELDGAAKPEVTWMFTCRSTNDDVPPNEDGGLFYDVAMIGHNAETGATCFFQSFPDREVRSRTFPSPYSGGPIPKEGVEEPWLPLERTARISCHRCHSNDPWIHSPWIDQLRDPDDPEKPLVPEVTDLDAPYWVVGNEFAEWKLSHIKPEGNACVTCHRMGVGTAQTLINFTSGDREVPTPPGQPFVSGMPPEHGLTTEEWAAAYDDDIQQLRDCARKPMTPGCNIQDVPGDPRLQ